MTSPHERDDEGTRRDELDPDMRRFVREVGAAWKAFPDLSGVPPAEARRIAELVRAPYTRGGPAMARTMECTVDTPAGAVRVRVYDPGGDGLKPALVYMHGGGWSIFSIDTHDRIMREYAARARSIVAGVDYALSPEAKYPVALEQVQGVVRHLHAAGTALGIDTARIALGGDSAGGNLALAAALALRDAGAGATVRALLLNYGVFTRWTSAEAERRHGGPEAMLTAAEMDAFWSAYVRDERDLADPLVCPLAADLHGLPSTLLVVAACDILAEQSHALAQRLTGSGVDTTLSVYHGASHSFLEAVATVPLAERAMADASAWLAEALAAPSR